MLHEFFWWRGCVISFVERLRDFVFGEVAWFFSLTHSLRLQDLFFWRLRDFFAERLRDFFVERLRDFLCEGVVWSIVWRGFLLKKKVMLVKTVFLWKKLFCCHYCHYCHYCCYCHYYHYCHYCHYFHYCNYCLVSRYKGVF